MRIKWSESQDCSNLLPVKSPGSTVRSLNGETVCSSGEPRELEFTGQRLTKGKCVSVYHCSYHPWRQGSVLNTTFQKRYIGEKIMSENRSHMIEVTVTGLS